MELIDCWRWSYDTSTARAANRACWGLVKGRLDKQAAEANLKLVEAEAKATIMKSAATSEAEWEKIMAQGTMNSWKDEYLVLLFSVPLILCFTGEWGRNTVAEGFAALEAMPGGINILGVIVASSFAVRSATKFFGGKK